MTRVERRQQREQEQSGDKPRATMRTDPAASNPPTSYLAARLAQCQQAPRSLLAAAESQKYLQTRLTRGATWSELADCPFRSAQSVAHPPIAKAPSFRERG